MLEWQNYPLSAAPVSAAVALESVDVAARAAVLLLSVDSFQLPIVYELFLLSYHGSPGQLALLP